MHLSNLQVLLLTTSVSATILDPRQATNNTVSEAYLQEVCFPPSTNPVPPCQSIINIQTGCEPNGTTPLALEAHSQCMCGGSFFSDWEGCLACQQVHGARSPQVASAFLDIISSASSILCAGTPTAGFAAIFSGLSAGSGAGEGGDNVASDRFPSQTAISLYYTLSTSQGPGQITGSATAATATGPTTERLATTSASGSAATGSTTSRRSTSSTTGGASAASTTSSRAGAAPTGVWMGALGVVAGGAVIAVL